MEQVLGRRLGESYVLERIGQGRMKEVFRGFNPGGDRDEAVAVLLPHLAREEDFAMRFQDEVRAAVQLKHTNIVAIYEADREGGLVYFTMAHLGGLPLNSLVQQRGILSAEDLVLILEQLAAALDYAHGEKWVHLDVRPRNMFVDWQHQVILSDFGLARAAYGAKSALALQAVGEEPYKAPELSSDGAIGPWTDLYALAAVAYELIAGQPPAPVQQGGPLPVCRLRPGLSAAVESVLARAMSLQRRQRYPSGADLVNDLVEALQAAPQNKPVFSAAAPEKVLDPTSGGRPSSQCTIEEYDPDSTSCPMEEERLPGQQEEMIPRPAERERDPLDLFFSASDPVEQPSNRPGHEQSLYYGPAGKTSPRPPAPATVYAQLRQALDHSEWEEAIRLAEAIPGYRDADDLGLQATRSRPRQRRSFRQLRTPLVVLAALLIVMLTWRTILSLALPAPPPTPTFTPGPTRPAALLTPAGPTTTPVVPLRTVRESSIHSGIEVSNQPLQIRLPLLGTIVPAHPRSRHTSRPTSVGMDEVTPVVVLPESTPLQAAPNGPLPPSYSLHTPAVWKERLLSEPTPRPTRTPHPPTPMPTLAPSPTPIPLTPTAVPPPTPPPATPTNILPPPPVPPKTNPPEEPPVPTPTRVRPTLPTGSPEDPMPG